MESCAVHSVPALCALLSLILNSLQFIQRHWCCSQARQKALSISLIWFGNVVIYILLLSGLSWIIYREKLCRVVVVFILLLSLNWILNLFSLYRNHISKNSIAIAFQVLASLLELVTITWLVIVSLTTDKIDHFPIYYWLILLGSALWGYLCNFLWLNSLYALRQSQSHYQTLLSDDETNSLLNDSQERISSEEAAIVHSVLYRWFTSVLIVGSGGAIEWCDLTELPESMISTVTRSYVEPPHSSSSDRSGSATSPLSHSVFKLLFSLVASAPPSEEIPPLLSLDDETAKADRFLPPLRHAAPLVRAILVDGQRGSTFLLLGSMKLLTIALSFVGPLLLGQMVKLIEHNPKQRDIPLGLLLACALGLSFIVSAILNTHYAMRANVLQMKVRSALSLGKSLTVPFLLATPSHLTVSRPLLSRPSAPSL
jgi:hypothetical protein